MATSETLELSPTQGLLVGTTLAAAMSTWVQQDAVTGAIYVDTVTASMNLMSSGPTPMVVGHPRANLEDVIESED